MAGYVTNIENETLQNKNFRKVLYTAPHSQLVLMSLKPNEEIGNEVHPDNDQFFRIDAGEGKIIFDNIDEHEISDGFAVIVPAGTWHNVINTSSEKPLRLYTIYSPAHHPDGTIHRTKDEAMAAEEMEHKG
jgi:mannose-6-phosphate isomerase-like protein (cupin superfamily)